MEREEALWVKRHLTFTKNGDGMYDVKGLLMPVDVAAVQTALDHIAGAAFADETGRPHHTRIGDAMVELCKAYNAGTVSGGRERPKVLIAVPFETVAERGAARGMIVGSSDTISGEAVRQLCCDAELNRVVTRGRSTILDYGTTTRLASDAQYYAMVARDGGCRWPGCDRPPGWTEAHHSERSVHRERADRFERDGAWVVQPITTTCITRDGRSSGAPTTSTFDNPTEHSFPRHHAEPIFATPRQLQLVDA